MEAFQEFLKSYSAGRFLDVATGKGDNIGQLIADFKDFEEAIGIDPSEKAIEAAKKSFTDPRISFQLMKGEKLQFPDESFDTVAISNSLHHLDQMNQALLEMKRVLKPGGLFIISEMYRDHLSETQMTHVHFHDWWAKVDSRAGIPHFPTFKRQELINFIECLNFSTVDYYDFKDLSADPKDEKTVQYLSQVCPTYPDKVADHPDYQQLKEEGARLIQRLHDIGLHWATVLIVFARK